jgi:hypothetical protein
MLEIATLVGVETPSAELYPRPNCPSFLDFNYQNHTALYPNEITSFLLVNKSE